MRVVVSPTFEQITLEQARLQCRIDDDFEDRLLGVWITAAREHAEQYTQRALATQTLAIEPECWPWPLHRYGAELPGGVVQSIKSVTYVDPEGAIQTLPANQYVLFAKAVPARWGLVAGADRPQVRPGPESMELQYVAGYSAGECPAGIVAAMLLCIAYWYENRGDSLLQGAPTDIPASAMSLLRPWRISPGF